MGEATPKQPSGLLVEDDLFPEAINSAQEVYFRERVGAGGTGGY